MPYIHILQETFAIAFLSTMVPFIVREVFQRHKVTILLYHKPTAQHFEKHLNYLIKKYSVISLEEFIKARNQNCLQRLPARPVILTFDDGARDNYTLREVLQRYHVPATFFVCSDILGTNRHFWFSYRQKVKKNLKTIADAERLKCLAQVGFDERKEFDTAEALSLQEVIDLRNAGVSIQSHTLTHPILPMCDATKAKNEIAKSKTDLEKKLGAKVDFLAYPNGDYLLRDVET